jgi:hypothetical protein
MVYVRYRGSDITGKRPPWRGTGILKFKIYIALVPKMLHTKFEKNWSSCYQKEVKILNCIHI